MRHHFRNAAVGLGVLVASKSVSAQSKSPGTATAAATVGIDRLVLDEHPNSNVTLCYSGTSKSSSMAATTDTLSIAPQAGTASVQVDFSVASIRPNTASLPMVLFLAYSSELETTAQLTSKNTSHPFLLGGGLNILAAYNLQPMTVQTQGETSIGQALGEPTAKLTFSVALDMAKVDELISTNANKLYFQAGLMTQDGLDRGDFSTLILSEVDTIEFKTGCTGTTTAQATSTGKTYNSGSTSVMSNNGSKSSSTGSSAGTKSGGSTGKSGSGGSSSTTGKSGGSTGKSS